jgi:hypothetical protein
MPAPTAPITPNRLLDAARDVGVVHSSVRYDLLNRDLDTIGELHPFIDGGAPVVSWESGARIGRTLRNFTIPGYEANDVDTYTSRVRPMWVLEDGTEWPLGVFLWERPDRAYHSWDSPLTSTLLDLGYVLDQAMPRSFGRASRALVTEAIGDLFEQAGFTNFVVQGSDVRVGDPIANPSGTTYGEVMRNLCELAAFPPPFFTAEGQGRAEALPPLRDGLNVHRYVIDEGSRVIEGTVTVAPDTANAGGCLVVSSGASKGEVAGVAYVDPALPWSKERRGFLVLDTFRTQGIESSEQAQRIAASRLDRQQGGSVRFDALPDPRHDCYQLAEFGSVGDLYRETGWSLTCEPGGPHTHHVTKGAGV